ncbi:MAG: hypothetical protein K6U74_00105 [Firmicutes bacterium]|nr:hypothetical protein [Bacillota bacterium]
MPLPVDNLTTLHLDAATDDPSQARVEIFNAVNKIKEIIAVLDDGAGSGINADLLDGINSVSFARKDLAAETFAGDLKLGGGSVAAWPATWSVVDVGDFSSIASSPSGVTYVSHNAYYDGTDWIAKTAGAASRLQFEADGTDAFYTAESVAAGAILNFKLSRKSTDVISVKSFGAVGDNVADDTAAIQAALNAKSGVLLPKGIYKVTAALRFNDNNFLIGEGRGSEIRATHNGAVIRGKDVTTAATTNVRRFHGGGRDFTIRGPGTASAASIALDMRGCTMFKWFNVYITAVQTAVVQGYGYSTYYNEYYGVDASTVVYGYDNSTLGNENLVSGGRVNDCTTGTRDADNSHNKYIGLAIEAFTGTAHQTISPATQQMQYLCSRIENGAAAGTGFGIDATSQDTQIMFPQIINMATDISNAGVRTNIIASENWTIASGTRIKYHQKVTVNIDFPSIAAQSTNDQSVAITGALSTDSVFVTINQTLADGLMLMAYPAAGAVIVRMANVTSAAIDQVNSTFTIDIWRH